jgi:selenocysteine-specific elongation factor
VSFVVFKSDMTEKHFVLATAGHVDHGKSALVKALTGTDPDRLPEEKARGISIELGFAQLTLPGPGEQRFHVGMVDVPGHEDFVRNMIAGVGSIDLALMVVAADDGWMPQTEEHFQILTYLGVKRAVIALTKSDLGGIEKTTSQIREQLRETALTQAPIVQTSVRTGEGIENLKRTLAAEFSTTQPARNVAKPRLFIDRAFTLHGIGTVVTGTLADGTLRRGQNVVVQPQNLDARIRSIQSHGLELESAEPGMRTAINLPDVAVGFDPKQIKRGDVITIVDLGRASSTLDVLLEKSPRLRHGESAAKPLKNGSSVHVYHGTTRFRATIALLEDHALETGNQAIAQLRLDSPIFAFLGDRFVLRDVSEQRTIAGGVVLDPDGDREKFRNAAQRKLLAARACAVDDIDVCVGSEIARSKFARRESLLRKSRFSAEEIAQALLRTQRRNEIVVSEEIVADAETWHELRARATHLIDDAHERNPERTGLDLSDLRAALRDQPPDLFEALISDLCRKDFRRKHSTIARSSHRPTLPLHLESAAAKIREALSHKSFDPPCRKEIALDRHAQQALQFLIEQGEAIEVEPDLVLLSENFRRMKTAVVEFISKNGPATVSQLRQALGTSRRVMVPFLEELDRTSITQREGDRRSLRDQEKMFLKANLLQ